MDARFVLSYLPQSQRLAAGFGSAHLERWAAADSKIELIGIDDSMIDGGFDVLRSLKGPNGNLMMEMMEQYCVEKAVNLGRETPSVAALSTPMLPAIESSSSLLALVFSSPQPQPQPQPQGGRFSVPIIDPGDQVRDFEGARSHGPRPWANSDRRRNFASLWTTSASASFNWPCA